MRLHRDEHQANPDDVLRLRVLEGRPGKVYHDDATNTRKDRQHLEQNPLQAAGGDGEVGEGNMRGWRATLTDGLEPLARQKKDNASIE